MKKVLSFMVMSLICLLPFVAKADTRINPSCGAQDAEGNITCTIGYNITDANGVDNLTVTLTEHGGAQILSIDEASDTDWLISSKNNSNGVWTVLLSSPGVSGEGSLFTFKYKVSGETDCKVSVALGDKEVSVEPPKADEPTDNKQTGSTLPYIALGTIALIAVGTYMTTKNKAKMYRI